MSAASTSLVAPVGVDPVEPFAVEPVDPLVPVVPVVPEAVVSGAAEVVDAPPPDSVVDELEHPTPSATTATSATDALLHRRRMAASVLSCRRVDRAGAAIPAGGGVRW
jgi:hypothetical protein